MGQGVLWCALAGVAWLALRSAASAEGIERIPGGAYGGANYGRMPDAGLDSGATRAEVDVTDVQAAGGIPFRIGDTLDATVALDYQYTHNEYTGVAGRDRDLHRLQLPFTLGREAGRYYLQGTLAPGVATSSNVLKDPCDEMSGDDLIVSAQLAAAWKLGNGKLAQLGLAYDRSFGAPVVYPVAAVELSPDPRVRVRLAFPDPAVTWQPGKRHWLSARLFPAGQQWHVVSAEVEDDFDYEMEAYRAQLTWSWQVGRVLVVDLAAGLEFSRHHEFTDDQRNRLSVDIDDQLYLVIGLRNKDAPILYSQGSYGWTAVGLLP